jgi:pilus assembly protein Flp/PilA
LRQLFSFQLDFHGEVQMSKLIKGFNRFVSEEDAPTMVEYGLLVALIALIVALGAATLGTGISSLFSGAATSL